MAVATGKSHSDHEPISEQQQQPKIAELFVNGDRQIERVRTDNLFKQLDERQLTEEEQAIIQKRVELQRKLFQEFEKRERHRKVQELQDVCPELTKEAAEKALELCSWKEEEAAVRFTSDPLFRKRVLASTGSSPDIPEELAARLAAVTAPCAAGTTTTAVRSKPASIPRPRLVDADALQQGHVFVGAFKGRLGPTQMAQQAKRLVDMGILRVKPGRGEAQKVMPQTPPQAAVILPDVSDYQQGCPAQDSSEQLAGSGMQTEEQQPELISALHQPEVQAADTSAPVATAQNQQAVQPAVDYMAEDNDNKHAGPDEDVEFEWGPTGIVYSQQGGQDIVRVCIQESQLHALVERAVQEAQNSLDDDNSCEVQAHNQQGNSDAMLEGLQSSNQSHAAGLAAQASLPATTTAIILLPPPCDPAQGVCGLQAAHIPADMAPAEKSASKQAELDSVVPLNSAVQLGVMSGVAGGSDDTDSRTLTASAMQDDDGGMISDAQGGCQGMDVAESDLSDHEAGKGKVGCKRRRAAGSGCSSKRESAACRNQGKAARQGQDDELSRDSDAGATGTRCSGRARTSSRLSAQRAAAACSIAAAAEEFSDEEAQMAAWQDQAIASRGCGAKQGRQAQQAGSQSSRKAAGRPTREPSPGSGSGSAQTACDTGAQTFVTLGSVLLATKKGTGSSRSAVAISARGHTNRGRVKQKGAKRAELLCVGTLRVRDGWFNAGYIFPEGFKSRTLFRSSVELAAVCVHECTILGQGGAFWPLPTFQVTAMDRPSEPLVAKSCTGCWSQALKRINSEIERRRAAGEDLPPAPKTAIAGPEYFGFNQPEVIEAVEALDPQHQCAEYWVGKEDRNAMLHGMLPVTAGKHASGSASARAVPQPAAVPVPTTAVTGARGRGRRAAEASAPVMDVEDAEDVFVGNRWNAIDRGQRYRRRCGEDAAGGVGHGAADEDHPLPGFIDPVTLELVVNPAISPNGHVMGLSTWKAVLAEHQRCPFTKQPLRVEQLVSLTKHNIERYKDRIIQQ